MRVLVFHPWIASLGNDPVWFKLTQPYPEMCDPNGVNTQVGVNSHAGIPNKLKNLDRWFLEVFESQNPLTSVESTWPLLAVLGCDV